MFNYLWCVENLLEMNGLSGRYDNSQNSIKSLDYFRNREDCIDTSGLSIEEAAEVIIKQL